MEGINPGLLSLFSERLLVTGGLDLLNEALTQATLFLEECLSLKPQIESLIDPKPKVMYFLKILLNDFFLKVDFRL